MGYEIQIVRVADGEARWCHEASPWDDGAEFFWTEGNGACDCNRAAAFARAMGEPDPNVPCGSSSYRVTHASLSGGCCLIAIDD